MNEGSTFSAGSQYNLDDIMDTSIDYDLDSFTQPFEQLQNEQMVPSIHEHSLMNFGDAKFGHIPGAATRAPQYFASQQHLSASSFSSGVSSFRSSKNSTFSQLPTRDSISSSLSGWSHTSDFSRDQYISQAEHLLTQMSSGYSSHAQSPIEDSTSLVIRKRSAQRRLPVEKDYFKTCVSANKHTRSCKKDQKYFCTVCKKPFVEKADWKRHEETYQERRDKFQCDLCSAIYFLDKDFATHHTQSHYCASCSENIRCSEKRHVRSAKQQRLVRTGWGCGFCCHFSVNWVERCNHIADHIEREEKTVANWYHSWVIYSLLQRPNVRTQWTQLLENKRGRTTDFTFSWNEHSTGRVEGYPESTRIMQLQDVLEYYTPDDDAGALARLAYDKMVKQATEIASSPPPVPPKDYLLTVGTIPWVNLADTIPADDIIPDDVCYLEPWHAG